MKDICYLVRLDQAAVLLKPGRIEILRLLAEPRSCTDVGGELGQPPQKVYYHVKRMEQAGLVDQVDARRVRGIVEGIYQAAGASYWLSPELVGAIGPRSAQDELSIGFLLNLAEEMQADLGRLASTPGDRPSLGLSGQVMLRPADRQQFLTELRGVLEDLFTRYGGSAGIPFRVAFACYPGEDVRP